MHLRLSQSSRLATRRRALPLLILTTALIVAGCSTGPPTPDPNLFLLIPNYSQARIEVLSAVDDPATLARDAGASFALGAGASAAAVVWGPDDRIYVADDVAGRILVYDADDALSQASPTPVATLTSASLIEPVALAFDAAGALWVADMRGSRPADATPAPVPNLILRLAGATAATGASTLTAEAVIDLHHDTSLVFGHDFLSSLYFDHLGRLWFTDFWSWTVFRIDDPGGFTGTITNVIPSLQFRSLDGTDQSLSPIRNPAAVALSEDGVLYVGNRSQNSVARFDDLGALVNEGNFNVPSAQLTVGVTSSPLLSLDPSGDLWVAAVGTGGTSEVVRVTGQDQGTGAVALTPQQKFAWATGAQNTLGGSAVFHQR